MAKGTVNQATVLGNLGDAPVLRYTSSGTPVASVSVATTERFKKNDAYEERTDWHRLIFYAGLAEIASKYLKKGSKVYVQGRMQHRTYVDKESVTRDTFVIVVENLQMLGDPRSAEHKEQEAFAGAYSNSTPVLSAESEPDPAEIPF